MIHPSFGPVPEEDFRAAEAAPAGVATNILRKHVPTFGLKPGQKARFNVTVKRTLEVEEEATVSVLAESEEDAKKKIDDMGWDEFDWDEIHSEPESFQILRVEGETVVLQKSIKD